MEFKLSIESNNAAMSNVDDVARVLHRLANRLEGSGTDVLDYRIFDDNGNKVGEWYFTGDLEFNV
jgi:hypothetical protein